MVFEGGSLIFLAVLILMLVGVIIGLYTRKGSGVDLHPYRHTYGGAPASARACNDCSGSDRTSVTERDVVRAWRLRRLAQDPDSIAAQLAETRARRRQQGTAGAGEATADAPPLGSPRPPDRRTGA